MTALAPAPLSAPATCPAHRASMIALAAARGSRPFVPARPGCESHGPSLLRHGCPRSKAAPKAQTLSLLLHPVKLRGQLTERQRKRPGRIPPFCRANPREQG